MQPQVDSEQANFFTVAGTGCPQETEVPVRHRQTPASLSNVLTSRKDHADIRILGVGVCLFSFSY